MWELLKDYLEAASDCSESNSSYNESVNDNISHAKENTNDFISMSTCSDNISSSQHGWKLPNTIAAKTLPEGLSLRCSNLLNAVFGVYATREIKKDTIFGPYVGTRNFGQQLSNNSDRLWKIFMNNKFHHYISSEDPETSNWMKYVNYAGHSKLQNLESFQFGYQIYYRVISDIQEGAELLVWYSEDYNQDCLNADGKLTKLIIEKTSATSLGSQCQAFEHKTANDNAPTAATNSISCDTNNYDVEDDTEKTHKKIHTAKKLFMCNATFVERSDVRRHTKTHTGEKPYKRDVCNAAFARSSHLIEHTGEKPYKCNVCNAAFGRRSHLKRHKRTHTGKKPYKCDVCNAAFAQSIHLIEHNRSHTDEKPYKCDVCNATFGNISNLRRHKKTHTGEKPYMYDVCNATFGNSSHLKIHKKTHTGEKPFMCHVCNATFGNSSHLKIHKRSLTGEKPYKCDVCNATFGNSSNLRRHKRTHTGEKPYMCDVCNATFGNNSHLKIHKRTHIFTKQSIENTQKEPHW